MPSRRTEVHRSFDNLISIHHLSHLHHCCPDTPSGDFLSSGHTNMHRRITHVVADKLLIVQTVLCKALRTVCEVHISAAITPFLLAAFAFKGNILCGCPFLTCVANNRVIIADENESGIQRL